MYQQPPELGGTAQDEKRAELPEQGMFELDGEDRIGPRGFYEPVKRPIGNTDNGDGPDDLRAQRPTQEPIQEPFHEPVREAVKQSTENQMDKPVSPIDREISPLHGDVSPVKEPAWRASRKPLIKDNALPPEWPRDE